MKIKLILLQNIIKHVEKPTTEYIVSIGIYVLNKHIIDTFVSEKNYLDFPTLINILIQDAQKINSFMHNGLWIDIGTTEEYINLVENLDKIVEENPLIPISV